MLKWLNEIRRFGNFKSVSESISFKTWDGFTLPDWQALPLETAIPFISKLNKSIAVLSSEKGKIIFENESEFGISKKPKNLYSNIGIGTNDNSSLDNMRPIRGYRTEIHPFDDASGMTDKEIEQLLTTYDYLKNIKHLILRYNNKQDTLHIMTSEYDEGLNDGLQTAIHDLEDILNGLEV